MKKLLLIASMMAIPFYGTAQTLLSEDFQSGSIPSTWTVQQTNPNQTWHVEDPLGGTDLKATVNYDDALGTQSEMLITPSLDFTTASNFVLKANIGLSYYWAVDPENNYDAFIKVSTDNGTTWTQVWSENDLGVFTNWTMNPVSINLGAYAGNANVKIAFHYVGQDGAALYVDNVKVEVPPSTPPNCATLTSPANAATGINYISPVPLSWTAPTGGSAVESYDIFLDTNPDPTTLKGNTTALTYNVTGLAPSTTYYWKAIAKNAAGSATGCTVFSFTTMDNPFAPYCGPLAITSTVEPITLVNFAGINNVTPAPTGSPSTVPSHENFTTIIGNVVKGETQTITLQGNTGGNWVNRFAVFIDWNQNGVLNDPGEVYEVTTTLSNSTGTDGKQVTHPIAVPATAMSGDTRMRVKKIFGTTNYLDPCAGASFGQVEDYTVNVATLAVADASKNQARVYPNPIVDIVNIDSNSKVSSVQVYDLSGKVVSTHTMNAVKNQINLGKLTPGVYMLKINTESGTQTVKVVKK